MYYRVYLHEAPHLPHLSDTYATHTVDVWLKSIYNCFLYFLRGAGLGVWSKIVGLSVRPKEQRRIMQLGPSLSNTEGGQQLEKFLSICVHVC